jgi:hypothetical protein
MKKKVLLLLFICVCLQGFSQVKFEKGYIIDNQNKVITCLIKNADWLKNPDEIEYKLSESSNILKANPSTIKAFQVDNYAKYLSYSGKMDKSTVDIDKITYGRAAKMEDSSIFIKTLVAGTANLYVYDSYKQNFFYSVNSDVITPLIFKKYLNSDNKIAENARYKQQLWKSLQCNTISLNYIESVSYYTDELTLLFKMFNNCKEGKPLRNENETQAKTRKGFFHVNAKLGLNFSKFSMEKNGNLYGIGREVPFENEISPRIGIELEYVLPFNKNKWSLFLEPTYSQYKSETYYKYKEYADDETLFIAEYKAMELPIGFRFYIFLNDDSKLFINGFYTLTFDLGSEIYDRDGIYEDEYDVAVKNSLGVGLGYKWKDKISIELRHNFSKNLISSDAWDSTFNSSNLIVGYSFL